MRKLLNTAAAITAATGVSMAPLPALAGHDIGTYVGVEGQVCISVKDEDGKPSATRMWTIDWVGGVKQLGWIADGGCVWIRFVDRKLRADVPVQITSTDMHTLTPRRTPGLSGMTMTRFRDSF